MSLWKRTIKLDDINEQHSNTLCEQLDIRITEIGDDYLVGTMPVDHRTHQPFGLLHGGASVVLAETLGSIGANLCLPKDQFGVGLDINANHLRSVRGGLVTGVAVSQHIGRSTQVWEIKIYDEEKQLICVSRLTIAVRGR